MVAFYKDVQSISYIPDQYVTEEMMYKAVKLNVDLIRSPRDAQNSFLSKRIVDFVLSFEDNHWDNLPKEFKTKEYALYAFDKTGRIPVSIDGLDLAFGVVLGILDRNPEGTGFHTRSHILEKLEYYKEGDTFPGKAIEALSDDFNSSINRAIACVALEMHVAEKAALWSSKHTDLTEVALELHSPSDLMDQSLSPLIKRKIAESSLDM